MQVKGKGCSCYTSLLALWNVMLTYHIGFGVTSDVVSDHLGSARLDQDDVRSSPSFSLTVSHVSVLQYCVL